MVDTMVGGGKDGGKASIWNGRYSSSSSKTLEAEDFLSGKVRRE